MRVEVAAVHVALCVALHAGALPLAVVLGIGSSATYEDVQFFLWASALLTGMGLCAWIMILQSPHALERLNMLEKLRAARTEETEMAETGVPGKEESMLMDTSSITVEAWANLSNMAFKTFLL